MGTETVLIVDDEVVVQRVLGDALRRAGYAVEVANNGSEALERLAQPGVDLLLLDLRLGDIDGVQVMQAARAQWPRLPIVMLTAHGSLPSAIAAVRYGAADYLLKPISVDALRERVTAVLADHQATQARAERLKSMYFQFQTMLRSEGLLHETTIGASGSMSLTTVYVAGPLRLDVQRHAATMHGQPVDLTPSEFAILRELLNQPGAAVSCLRLAQAIQTVAEDEEEARQLIRPHIVRLRRKLEADPQQPCHLISVRGIGYRWDSSASSMLPAELCGDEHYQGAFHK